MHRPDTEEGIVGALHVAEAFDDLRYVRDWLIAYTKAQKKAAKKRPRRRGRRR